MSRAEDKFFLGLMLRAHIWLVASCIPLLVKFLSIKHLLRLASFGASLSPYAGISGERIACMVAGRLKNPVHMRRRKCLRHGLTLFHFLRLAGLPAVLHICVYPRRLDRHRMHAHCWVTLEGRCLSPPPEHPGATILSYGA